MRVCLMLVIGFLSLVFESQTSAQDHVVIDVKVVESDKDGADAKLIPGNSEAESDFAAKPARAVPIPTRKDAYPREHYDTWLKWLNNRSFPVLDNPDSYPHLKKMANWNRFLIYFKLLTDDSSQILQVFMKAYEDDKHGFCAQYSDTIPRLTSEDFSYCLEHYKNVKPVMDEIVRLTLDSYDQELVKQLKEIRERDQSLRAAIPDDAPAEEQKRILNEQRKIDLKNLAQIEKIIEQHGYPGRSLVGVQYEDAAFLVIHHCGGQVIEKYLPLIKAAIENKDLESNVYPYLYDRVEIENGRPQYFGTQRTPDNKDLLPLREAENVNERREKYGLSPLSSKLKKGSSSSSFQLDGKKCLHDHDKK